MRDVEKLISEANVVMREKLNKYSNKPDWGNLTIQELIRLSDGETKEIKMAIFIFEHNMCNKRLALEEIKREAADRMNYDAMLIQKCNTLLEKMNE